MSKLYFESHFKSYELSALDLPIEIRKLNLAIVAQFRLSQSVELKPGTYHVIARLPGGQELYNQVQVVENSDTLVVLTHDSEDVPSEANEKRYFLGRQQDNATQIDQLELLNRDDNDIALHSTKRIIARLRTLIGYLLPFIKRTKQTDGLLYTIKRLKFYIRLGEAHFPKAKLLQARPALASVK